jgi:hypothetical protein
VLLIQKEDLPFKSTRLIGMLHLRVVVDGNCSFAELQEALISCMWQGVATLHLPQLAISTSYCGMQMRDTPGVGGLHVMPIGTAAAGIALALVRQGAL